MKSVTLLVFALSSTATLFAQIGDKPGEAQVAIVPDHLIPAAPALSPEDELKTFRIAPGYRVELVASDPLVQDPVAMDFGPDGRIWVAEMRGYMPDLDGHGEDKPVGRIVILSDTDGDGRMDQSEVFLDGLILPRALLLVEGGVLVGTPPYLRFYPNNNGRPGQPMEVASDFGIQVDPAKPQLANPERAPNSLLLSHDNWIYSSAYAARFQFRNGHWHREASTFRGQWGLSQDDWGHLFYNNNSDQLRADLLPSHYLGRNPHIHKPLGTNWKVAREQFVWPARVNPGVNRGYRPETLLDYRLKEFDYRLKEFTAACAPWVYRGGLFPDDAAGNAFVCEPAGNLIKRNILTSDLGTLDARSAYSQSEFLASTDERFRPVNLTTGPEGALYIVDFYRGVIQHRIALTSYLREQIEHRNLQTPIGLGRIWRVVPEGSKASPGRNLTHQTPADWITELSDPNAWRRETAQRLLVEQRDPSLEPALAMAATSASQPMGRLHALWTLAGLNLTRWSVLTTALEDPDPRVRAAAIRISETHLASSHRGDVLLRWTALSAVERVPEVQLQLALSMGAAADNQLDLATITLAERARDLPLIIDAALSGMAGRELETLEALLQKGSPYSQPLLLSLARCVWAEQKPARIERLLDQIATLPPEAQPLQSALLQSLAAHPTVTAKYPAKLRSEPTGLARLLKENTPALRAILPRIQSVLMWPGKPGTLEAAPVTALSADEQIRFDAGKQLFLGLCAACHQPHGKGMEGLAPPLLDSEWVLGSVERLGRIVLHGIRGPLRVKGAGYNLDMPAMGFLDDTQTASVLTYIRREWDHTAAPVTPETVRQLRDTTSTRTDAWTEPELLQLP